MKTNILFLLIIQLLFITSCEFFYCDEKLTLPRTDYFGNEIRTDGYYYCVIDDGCIAFQFFYRNGTVIRAFSYSNMNEAEEKMVKYISNNKITKQDWGVFLIEGERIEHEVWERALGKHNLIIRRHSGIIENDTTIHYTKSYSSETKETYNDNYVYHFKQFDNKPDSTNNFIK
jgi:hypothetical protein